jgi:hypothetical protein
MSQGELPSFRTAGLEKYFVQNSAPQLGRKEESYTVLNDYVCFHSAKLR